MSSPNLHRRIGLLGGTFNPIHNGHLRIVEIVRNRLHLHRILLIPCGTPPHKQASAPPTAEQRLSMIRLALAEHPHCEASDLECRFPEKAYTVHTLERLRQAFPQDDFFFIIGADAFSDLGTWREVDRLLTLCHFVIVTRPDVPFSSCPNLPLLSAIDRTALSQMDLGIRDAYDFVTAANTTLFFLGTAALPISASQIREKVAAGESVHNLLPVQVESYIIESGFYRGP